MIAHRPRAGWIPFGVVVIFVAGLLSGRLLEGKGLAQQAETYEELRPFTEVLNQVQRNYVEETTTRDVVYGAIRGLLNVLDPHSSFMPPDVYKEMQVDTKGEFGGVGIQIGLKDERLTVIAPIEDTPAFRAGVLAGDKIVKIDGTSTKDMTLMDGVNKMRGAKGTKVTLTLERSGTPEPIDVVLTRETIKVTSTRHKMLEDGIGYVRLTQFQEQSGPDLAKALNALREQKAQSFILDLRNNPGGLLTAAVEVSEQFLPKGKAVVSIKGRHGSAEEYPAEGAHPILDAPLIVLVNEGSASASEIVAGAMQDWGRAVVVGTTTFGKGSVQTVIPLSDGSALRLTTAKYYTPKGRSIQNTGITPTIVVRAAGKGEGRRPTVRERDLERHLPNPTGEPQAPAAPSEPSEPVELPPIPDVPQGGTGADDDIQLQKAIELLKSWAIFKGLLDQPEPSVEAGQANPT
ncbi:MAG: S41 family peptidase [Nitrospirota bacterium]